MSNSFNSLVESVAAMLCAEELELTWDLAHEKRREMYRTRARRQLAMIAARLEKDGWVMLPQKLTDEEGLEIAMRNLLATPRAMKEGEEFVLSPQIIQTLHASVIQHVAVGAEPPAKAAGSKS